MKRNGEFHYQCIHKRINWMLMCHINANISFQTIVGKKVSMLLCNIVADGKGVLQSFYPYLEHWMKNHTKFIQTLVLHWFEWFHSTRIKFYRLFCDEFFEVKVLKKIFRFVWHIVTWLEWNVQYSKDEFGFEYSK